MMVDELPLPGRRPVPAPFVSFPDWPSRSGGVEAHVAKPAADDCDVDARRDEVNGSGVAEAVRRHMLISQRWHGFGCRFNISR